MINKVILLGRTGVDPEIRATKAGAEFATMSLATSKKIKDKTSGQWNDKTTWHKVVTFDENLVKTIKNYVKKGTQLYIEGEIDVSEYVDKDGKKKYTTSIQLPRYTGIMRMVGGESKSTNKEVSNNADIDDDIPVEDIPF
jgi:single-strand DNA-binding protein